MIYCFDIDGTLCNTKGVDYSTAVPKVNVIQSVKRLFMGGDTIKLYTARGSETGEDWRKLTEKQLAEWGIQYHELHFGKPSADAYIDDKAVSLMEVLKHA